MIDMLQICERLFDYWDRKITYIHWKSNEHLDAGLNGLTDLDVLVRKYDKSGVVDDLRELGFIQCQSQFASKYPEVEDWIGCDKETGKLVHVHLHFIILTGHTGLKEYNLPWTEVALETRVVDKETGVYIMNPNLELVTLYTRIGLKATFFQYIRASVKRSQKCRVLKRHSEDEIDYLNKRVDWNEVERLTGQYYGERSGEIIQIMKSGPELSNGQFVSLYRMTRQVMGKYSRYNSLYLLFVRPYYSITSRTRSWLKRKFGLNMITRKVVNEQKGLSIAFIGQDGAGKSTISKEIEKWLSWKLDVKSFYMGSGEHYQPWEKRVRNKSQGRKDVVSSMIRHFLTISMILSYSRKMKRSVSWAQNYMNKGGIVIYDRFPQSQYPGINDGPKIRYKYMSNLKKRSCILSFFSNIEERNIRQVASYSPNVVFKLRLPIEESLKRKPDEDRLVIEKKNVIIADLTFEGAAVYQIDASKNYEAELSEIKNIIWGHIIALQKK